MFSREADANRVWRDATSYKVYTNCLVAVLLLSLASPNAYSTSIDIAARDMHTNWLPKLTSRAHAFEVMHVRPLFTFFISKTNNRYSLSGESEYFCT